jgi:DNA-binding MarR family transcriptional regulator
MYGKPEHARGMMLKFIDEKGEATKQEIAVHLKRTPTSLKYHLLWLERNGMIKSRSNNVLKVYAINR